MSILTKKTLAASAAVMALLGGAAFNAHAQTHYFTQGSTLYSTSDNGATLSNVTITFGGSAVTISSLAFDPSGDLWGGTVSGGSVYKINPTTGVATTTPVGSLGGQSNTFDFRLNNGVTEIAVFSNNGGGNNTFRVLNAATGTPILAPVAVGQGNPGVPASAYLSGNSIFGFGGTNYDLYAYSFADGASTLIGNTGITWSQAGGAAYNGQLWLGSRIGSYNTGTGEQNHGTSGFQFGTVNTATGTYTNVFNVAQQPFGGGFGYAISAVPEPETYAMLLAGLALTGFMARRRQQAAV